MTLSDFIFGSGAFIAGASMFWLFLAAFASMQQQRANNKRKEEYIAQVEREIEETKIIYRLK